MPKKFNIRTSIVNRIMLFVVLLVLTGLSAVIGVGFFWGYNLLLDAVGESQKNTARLLAQSVTESINEKIRSIDIHLSNPIWEGASRQSDLQYEGADEESLARYFRQMGRMWADSSEDEAIAQERLDNLVSFDLKRMVAYDGAISEMFLTDRHGGLVAASGKISDFYHADKAWWRKTYNKGEGRTFIGRPELDESGNLWSITFALPMRGIEGEVIGVCKALIDIKAFFEPLGNFRIGKTGQAVLVDERGYIVFYPGLRPFEKRFCGEEDFKEAIKSGKKWHMLKDTPLRRGKAFAAFAEIKQPALLREGMAWRVFIDQSAEEVFGPLRAYLLQGAVAIVTFLLVLFPAGLILAEILVKPIKKLKEATERISAGDLDYNVEIKTGDEIEELADSFKRMISNIKDRQKEALEARAQLEDWSKALERKVRERTGDLTTAQREALKALSDLESSKSYIENVLANFLDLLIVVDMNGVIKTANQSALKTLGYAEEQLIGKHAEIVFEYKPFLVTLFGQILKSSSIMDYEIEFITRQQRKIPMILSASVMKDAKNKPVGIVIIAKDITERKKIERKIEDLAKFPSETPYPVLRIAGDGTLLYANPASLPFLIEWGTRSGQPVPAEWRELIVDILDLGLRKTVEIEHRGRTFSFVIAPVKEGAYANLYGRDITDQRRAGEKLREAYTKLKDTQAQLIQAGKLEAVGRMASGIAHEVKNPLGIIVQGINYLESKCRQKGEHADLSEILEMMKKNIKRADNIISTLVDFSRASKLNTVPEDINAVLENSLILVEHRIKLGNAEIVRQLGKGLPKALVDVGKIEQVFVNIFLNAVQAMPEGGKLFIRSYVKELEGPSGRVGGRHGDFFRVREKAVVVEVEDTGAGISEEEIKLVFDPFFTTKAPKEGTGLGLSVTKNIIDMHEGLIDIKSQKGKGTKVIISLKTPGG